MEQIPAIIKANVAGSGVFCCSVKPSGMDVLVMKPPSLISGFGKSSPKGRLMVSPAAWSDRPRPSAFG
jgi:hypothetical protein